MSLLLCDVCVEDEEKLTPSSVKCHKVIMKVGYFSTLAITALGAVSAFDHNAATAWAQSCAYGVVMLEISMHLQAVNHIIY